MLSNTYIPNNLLSNDFNYKEQIYSVYGMYENSYKKFGYQVGLTTRTGFHEIRANGYGTKFRE